jgi:hypothetical protein
MLNSFSAMFVIYLGIGNSVQLNCRALFRGASQSPQQHLEVLPIAEQRYFQKEKPARQNRQIFLSDWPGNSRLNASEMPLVGSPWNITL